MFKLDELEKNIGTAEWKDATSIIDKVPIERVALFLSVKELLIFCKEHNIEIEHELHGDVY